jgi:exosortase family protein XrtM
LGDILRLSLYLRFLIKRNRKELTFIVKFILFFIIGQAIYLTVRPSLSPLLTGKLTASVGAHLINLFMPGEHAFAAGSLISGSVSLNIIVGCDGIEGLILVLAALGAYPMSVSRKWTGIGIGAVLIYIANLLRVVALYYTLKLDPDAFSFMHMYAGQAFIIFVGFLFFLAWVGKSSSNYEAAN